MSEKKKIGVGFYSGLGDLFAMLPSLRNISQNVDCFVIVKSWLERECAEYLSVEFPNVQIVPFDTTFLGALRLICTLKRLNLDAVYVSPHAPVNQSSWSIPVLCFVVRVLFCFDIKIYGDCSDRLAFLYSNNFFIDRSQPVAIREGRAMSTVGLITEPPSLPPLATTNCEYDVFIHYGASSENKLMSVELFNRLVCKVAELQRVVVFLPPEVNRVDFGVAEISNVIFRSGSIGYGIELMKRSKAVISHDTGFAHIAAFLGKPQIVLFGPTDPLCYAPWGARVINISASQDKLMTCMPCMKKVCMRSDDRRCMDVIDINSVAQAATQMVC